MSCAADILCLSCAVYRKSSEANKRIIGSIKENAMLFEDNIPYNTLKTLLIVIGTLGMMCTTTRFKYSAKRVALIFFLYLSYVAASSASIITFLGYPFYLRVFPFTISVPAIVLVFKLAKDQPAKAVFIYTTQILISSYASATVTLINTAINGTELTDFFMRFMFYALVILLEYRFLRRPFLWFTEVTNSGWLVLALIPCSLLAFSVTLASYPIPYTQNPTNVVYIYLLSAVIAIIYFSIFQYLAMQYRLQMTKQNLELMEVQVNRLKDKLSADAIAAEKFRIDRHDTRHILCTAASLLKNEKPADALDYISQSIRRFQAHTPVRYCQDVIINATLSTYFEQAKEAGIVLETRLQFTDTLPIDSGEIAIVIANALENAINACLLLPKEKRRIAVQCICTPKFMLEISNSCKEEVLFSKDGLPLSRENGHGIGTRSIFAGQFVLRIVL